MTDGIVLIDKPADMTSFGVVARVRRLLTQQAGKKIKVGHTGTLDPFATGLMIIVVGKECKNAEMYNKKDKTYEATIHLGQTSTTGDPEGEISDISEKIPSLTELNDALNQFKGEITQQPPIYSAIKIDGERAYKLARAGKTIDMPKRQITVHTLDLFDYSYPDIKIRTNVSSGTYIRTLAEDIGTALGTGAYCTALRRTHIDVWSIDDAQTLQEFGILNP
jgi:tRNA pseudouridine55 synthase